MRALIAVLGGGLLLSSSACEEKLTAPRGEMLLESLEFMPAEIEAGRPFVVVGRTAHGELLERQPLLLRTAAGPPQQGTLVHLGESVRNPWDRLTPEELAAVIGAWDHGVFIGFKEFDQAQGVDDQGGVLTSSETVERMKEWVRGQGVVITFESVLMPIVAGTMAAEPHLVTLLRAHENIDYLSPQGLVELEGGHPAGRVDLLAAFPGESGALLPGELVTAEYRQPDGSVLRATARVR